MILNTCHLSCEWTQVLNFSVSKLQNNGSLKLQDTTNYISLGLSKEWVESLSRSRSLSLSLSLCLSLSRTLFLVLSFLPCVSLHPSFSPSLFLHIFSQCRFPSFSVSFCLSNPSILCLFLSLFLSLSLR